MNDLFSERYGHVVKTFQFENLDKVAKAHLWDEIDGYFLSKAARMYLEQEDEHDEDYDCRPHAIDFYYSIHRDFWGKPTDEFTDDPIGLNAGLRNIVMNTMWYNTFDIIEALIRIFPKLIPNRKKRKIQLKAFYVSINEVFEDQKCAYRIVAGLVIPNVNNAEINTIASALTETDSIKTVNTHLEQALKLYSNRGNPDYRNSIKESILALESLIKLIVGSKNGTMADALKLIKKNGTLGLHQALQTSLTSLYGWAGDESGVRHHLKDNSKFDIDDAKLITVDSDDAKLIIVTCCSFVSYLLSKAIKSGIEFNKK